MGVSSTMSADRIAVLLYQLLYHEEAGASAACEFSLEVIKRNEHDEHAALKHYENCWRLRLVKNLTRKIQEALDSMKESGV